MSCRGRYTRQPPSSETRGEQRSVAAERHSCCKRATVSNSFHLCREGSTVLCERKAHGVQGTLHTAATIIKNEGVLALWNGVGPTILRNGTNQMCLFWAKNNLDRIYWDKHEGDGKKLSPGQSMLSGFSAACLGPVATGPFDVVKTRLMAQEKSGTLKYKGFAHALVTIPREEGLRAMWKGLLPRLMRIPPGQAIVWAVSDQIVHAYEDVYVR